AKERAAVESIENALGFVSPRMAEFADLETLGAIKYQFAAVQALFQNVVQRVMRRLYQKTTVDRLQLHQYYEFQPRYGGKTLAIARELGAKFGAGRMTVPGVAGDFQDPAGFYAARPDWLGREAEEVPCGWIHGDLNLANILLDETGNTWMIDYVWTRVGHAVQDIAKLENDLKFIKVPLADDPALQRAIDWERLLLADDDQLAPAPALPARLAADPAIAKAQAAITILRDLRAAMLRDAGLAAPLSARHYWLAQLRYSAHTLTFDESDVRQKRFALASTALLAERLR
ncbi:MAG: phosphotransferase, partial [Candidatus Sericytochromatia bacterium]|nr:phosphotransferase [Candidatus Sericytochromatia bacterium]